MKEELEKIELSWDLPHPPGKVWRALTEPELVAQWLMSNDLKLQVGHRFTFKTEPAPWWDGIVNSEIIEIESGRRLVYTWGTSGPKEGLDSRVIWTLTAIEIGTRLALEHTGFKPGNKFAYEGAKKGWDRNVAERMSNVLVSLI